MSPSPHDIPVLRFETLDSTNEEASRQLSSGAMLPLWIVAGEQTRGRGRSGRRWTSPKGNLYATLAFGTQAAPAIAPQLSFVAGLAAHSAAAAHLPVEKAALLRLKWPNDLMLDGAKLAGVLLESLCSPNGEGLAVILGVGMNVASAPDNLDRAVASLSLDASAIIDVFQSLASAAQTWLTVWNDGAGFPAIREAWLARALALGEPIRVNLNGTEIRGMFRGVDPGGALQLETGPAVVRTITAGDIYLDAQS